MFSEGETPHSGTVDSLASRLQDVSIHTHLRVLLLHGWSPGPNLPASLLQHGLFALYEIPASHLGTILKTPYAVLAVLLVTATTVLATKSATISSSMGINEVVVLCVILLVGLGAAYICKLQAVAFVIDSEAALVRRAVQTFQPDIVVGYSWGGAIAVEALYQGIWQGPTLLLNPAASLLFNHAGRCSHLSLVPPPKRIPASCDIPVATIIASREDPLVGEVSCQALADSLPGTKLHLITDDHLLSHHGSVENLAECIVELMERRQKVSEDRAHLV